MATLTYFDVGSGTYKPIDLAADGAVWVGPDAPTDPAYKMWIDTDDFSDQAPKDNRNRIINGDFSVNQRGFTSLVSANGFGLDRWAMYGVGGAFTYSAQSPALGDLPESARTNARIVTSGQAAVGDYSILSQLIESVRTLSGKKVTLSFWAKAAAGTPKVAVEFAQNFGTGGSPSTTVFTLAGQITLSTVWTRYSITVDIPSIVGKVLGSNSNDSLGLNLWTSAGSSFSARTGSLGIQNATIDLWGVQVEEGVQATAFEQKTYAEELRACQRYYYRRTADSSPFAQFGIGFSTNTTTAIFVIQLPVKMRAAPVFSSSAPNTFGGTALVQDVLGQEVVRLNLTATYAAANLPTNLQANSTQAAYLEFSAEL